MMKTLFRDRRKLILTLFLLAQAATFYGFSRQEYIPSHIPLVEFPKQIGPWSLVSEGVIEKEILDVLQADDTLNRLYLNQETGRVANVFIAYFMTQRTGKAPHSPKNCLPGGGWFPLESRIEQLQSTQGDPFRVNRYIVAREDSRALVLYWYQTPFRGIASEYQAKFYLVLDGLRYNRSDTALVRIVTPVSRDTTEEDAYRQASAFAAQLYPLVHQYCFPN